jgi:hypothetical protein
MDQGQSAACCCWAPKSGQGLAVGISGQAGDGVEFSIQPCHQLVMLCNQMPQATGNDGQVRQVRNRHVVKVPKNMARGRGGGGGGGVGGAGENSIATSRCFHVMPMALFACALPQTPKRLLFRSARSETLCVHCSLHHDDKEASASRRKPPANNRCKAGLPPLTEHRQRHTQARVLSSSSTTHRRHVAACWMPQAVHTSSLPDGCVNASDGRRWHTCA